MTRPAAWFPNWRDECVAIVASGPSTSKATVERLRDRIRVIAIKRNVELCPWADAVYGCDGHWWRSVQGLPDFRGLKISWNEGGAQNFRDVHPVEIKITTDEILTQTPGVIGSGGNSGFQALNLAVQFGARGVVLVGFDMQAGDKVHWYGRNTWHGSSNPSEDNFRRWQSAFVNSVGKLAALDVQVINTSQDSALRCFAFKTIDAALADWGL